MCNLMDKIADKLNGSGYKVAEYRPDQGMLLVNSIGDSLTIMPDGKVKLGNHLLED